jgi:hypothetical protein
LYIRAIFLQQPSKNVPEVRGKRYEEEGDIEANENKNSGGSEDDDDDVDDDGREEERQKGEEKSGKKLLQAA